MSNAIELVNVSKQFGPIPALDNINLTIQEGEFVSIVGPSGCGKTTLLRIVAGLEKPTQGEVRVNGDSPKMACQKRQIGVAFQRPALVASRTALQNVELTIGITGVGGGLSAQRILTDFGLDPASHDKYPHQLSGGMQQRVDLACAIVHNPEVLLLDEPFGPLDELTREMMGEWLGGILNVTTKTVLFITHNVDEAVLLSDRVVILSRQPGRIAGIRKINLKRPRTREMRTHEGFLAEVANVRRVLNRVMKEGAA